VTIALDGAMEAIVDAIAARVLTALQTKPPAPEPEKSAAAAPQAPPPPIMENVRRVNTLRVRSTSILGLESPAPE
jgi:hypothetical protein